MARNLDLETWRSFFADVGLEASLSDAYLEYASPLIDASLPVIFDLGHLAALLGRTEGYIASVINAPENHYRKFEIPKRRAGKRLITAPYPALLECQRWINRHILKPVPLHAAVHGFVPRRSILSNASAHTGHRELLKIDIKEFFPTISINRVIGVFQHLGYAPNVAFFLVSGPKRVE